MNDFVTVFSTEFMRRLRSKPFIVGVILGVVSVVLMLQLPELTGRAIIQSAKNIVLAGPPEITAAARPLLAGDFRIVAMRVHPDPAQELTASGAGAVVVLERTPYGIAVTAYAHDASVVDDAALRHDLLPLQVAVAAGLPVARARAIANVPVRVQLVGSRFASTGAVTAAQAIAFVLLFFLYMLVLLNSQLVMSSVVEEKTSRVAELLVAAIDPSILLAAKVTAGGALALVQLGIWVAAGLIATPHTPVAPGAPTLSGLAGGALDPATLLWFLVLFVVGFLQLSLGFAGLGSLISRTEDLGGIGLPLVFPTIAGYMIAIFGLNLPSAPIVTIASLVPIVSPFVLFARLAVSSVPLWQSLLSLALNLTTLALIVLLAGKLYRVGMLLYGRPPRWRQIWNVLRS